MKGILKKLYSKFLAPSVSDPLHLQFDFECFPPLIKIQTHERFVQEKLKKIGEIDRKLSFKKYINQVLLTAKGCNFVIFAGSGSAFIQYWVGNDSYWFDFPIQENNANKYYKEAIVKLLRKMQFKKIRNERWKYRRYGLIKTPERLIIEACFGEDTELVAEFSCLVLQKIFKTKKDSLKIGLG